jgi:hypothetical protein
MPPKRLLPRMPFPSTTSMVIRKKKILFKFADATTKGVRIVVGNSYSREFKAEDQPFEEEIVLFNQFLAKRSVFRRI